MKKLFYFFLLFLLFTSKVSSHDAPKTSKEKLEYINNHLQIFEIEAKTIETSYEGVKPGVKFAIKNNGNESLTKVRITIYFLDKNGKTFYEKSSLPVWSKYGEMKVLKPNYTFRMDKNKYLTFDNLGNEWTEKVIIKITEIEFAE